MSIKSWWDRHKGKQLDPEPCDYEKDRRIAQLETALRRHREIFKWMHNELPMLRPHLNRQTLPQDRARQYDRLMYLLGRLVAEIHLDTPFNKTTSDKNEIRDVHKH